MSRVTAPMQVKDIILLGSILRGIVKDAHTEYMLKAFELYHHFDYIGCGDDPLSPKPAIDHGLAFVDKFQLFTHEMLMVGDSVYDAMFAERLNMGFKEIRSTDDLEKLYG